MLHVPHMDGNNGDTLNAIVFLNCVDPLFGEMAFPDLFASGIDMEMTCTLTVYDGLLALAALSTRYYKLSIERVHRFVGFKKCGEVLLEANNGELSVSL